MAEKATEYLLIAGEQARHSSANAEAIAHLTQGLELLRTLPETPERAHRELETLVSLGIPLVLTRSHAAAEVETTYARALELSSQVGDATQRYQILLGMHRFYLHRGKLGTAYELGEQLLALALDLGNVYISRAHLFHGEILDRMGEFSKAQEHFVQCITAYHPQHSDAHLFGNDALVLCQVMQGRTLWQLGYPDQALQVSLEGLSRARQLSHPFTLVCGLYFMAVLHDFRREPEAVRDKLESMLAISRDRGFVLYSAWGTALLGHELVEQNIIEEGTTLIQQGLAAWQDIAKLLLPNFLFFLAKAHGRAGRVKEGLRLIDQALSIEEETGERTYEAELQRLQGELFLARGDGDAEVEACFQKALQVAHSQDARSWELRAAMSLSRLWQKQGKNSQASELLSGVYHWFTEGLATPDLQDARALLEELKREELNGATSGQKIP